MTTGRIARYAKLVEHDDVFAWLACGWMVHRDDAGWYRCNDGREGQYGTLLVWVCDCEMRRPIYQLADDKRRYRTFSGVTTLGQLEQETQRDYDEEGLYGWSINRRSGL